MANKCYVCDIYKGDTLKRKDGIQICARCSQEYDLESDKAVHEIRELGDLMWGINVEKELRSMEEERRLLEEEERGREMFIADDDPIDLGFDLELDSDKTPVLKQ